MRVLITLYSLTTMNLPDPDIKLAFRQRREKAMTLGDRESVAVLGQSLLYMGDRLGTTQRSWRSWVKNMGLMSAMPSRSCICKMGDSWS